MRHTMPISPQFYVTAPQPCPYIEGKMERKLFAALHGDSAQALNDILSHQGFRRSQNVVYRPSCANCSLCLSARIRVSEFKPSRSQRRVIRKNEHLVREGSAPWATEDQYELFRSYLTSRHQDGGMAEMDVFEFAAMVEETPVRSRVVEYRTLGTEEFPHPELTAVCLTDVLSDGLSMVYSFYDPRAASQSLGTYVILDHIQMAIAANLPYVYLGYWVPGSSKMDYKANFGPLEIYKNGEWIELGNPDEFLAYEDLNANDPISEQVAAIHLPEPES